MGDLAADLAALNEQLIAEKERAYELDVRCKRFESKGDALEKSVADLQRKLERLAAKAERDKKRLTAQAKAREAELQEQAQLASTQAAAAGESETTEKFELEIAELKAAHAKELEQQSEKLRSATRRRAQSQAQLASTQSLLEERTESFARVATERDELNSRVEAAEKRLDEAESLTSKQAASLTEITEQLSIAEETVSKLNAEKELLTTSASAAETELVSLRASVATFEAELRETRSAVTDQALEYKIASRRSVQLIKDLKSQLAKECDSGARIADKLGEREQEVERLRDRVEHLEQSLQRAQPRSDMTGTSLGSGGGGTFRSPKRPPAPPKDDGVKQLLAKRLEQLLGENQAVQEKVRFLEGCIQSVTKELDEKRVLLRHFTSSGARSGGFDDSDARSAAVSLSSATKGANRETMESLLETSLLENIRLKRDMKRMGKELLLSQRQHSEATNISSNDSGDDVTEAEL